MAQEDVPERDHLAAEPVELPVDPGSPAAGDDRLPVPRPRPDQPGRVLLQRRLPGRRQVRDRHLAPVLRRRQPGRDLRRRAERDRPGLHAGGTQRRRHGLRAAAHPQQRLPRVRAVLLRRLPRPTRARDAVLVRSRTCGITARPTGTPSIDQRPAARTRPPLDPDDGRVRRPPGDQLGQRDRGPHDRRPAARAGARPRPLPRPDAVLGHPTDPLVPVHRLGGDGRRRPRSAASLPERRRARCATARLPALRRRRWTTSPTPPDVDPHGPDWATTTDGEAAIGHWLQPHGSLPAECDGKPCYMAGFNGAGSS